MRRPLNWQQIRHQHSYRQQRDSHRVSQYLQIHLSNIISNNNPLSTLPRRLPLQHRSILRQVRVLLASNP